MLAILAPYDRSETTLAALRVADLAVEAGYDVSYIVAGSKGQGIHRYWDDHAVPRRGIDKLKKLLPSKFQHIVSFGLQPFDSCIAVLKLGLVTEVPFHDVVVQPYDLRRCELVNWATCQRIICSSESLYRLASGAGRMSHGVNTITKLYWATGDDSTPTEVDESNIRFAAVCDSGCLREYPEIWLHTVDRFLSSTVSHSVGCYMTSSLPRRSRSILRDIMCRYPDRFRLQRALNVQDFLIWLRDHDIAVYPSCYTVFGMYPAVFKGMNMPFMASKISPITEMAPDTVQSCLVPMPSCTELNGVDRALFDANRWLESWLQLANNPIPLLSRRESADGLRQQSAKHFNDFWRMSWQATLQ